MTITRDVRMNAAALFTEEHMREAPGVPVTLADMVALNAVLKYLEEHD